MTSILLSSCSSLNQMQYFIAENNSIQTPKDWSLYYNNLQAAENYIDRTYYIEGVHITSLTHATQNYSIGPILIPFIPTFGLASEEKLKRTDKVQLYICLDPSVKSTSIPYIKTESEKIKCDKAEHSTQSCQSYNCPFNVAKSPSFTVTPLEVNYTDGNKKFIPELTFSFRDELDYIWNVPFAP